MAEPGRVVVTPGSGEIENHPRLRLPPGVDDRALSVTDVLAVPHPRLGIDRLADAPEQTQGREVVFLGPLRAPLHERADRRRSGVEDRDAVALDQVPEPVARRRVGRALVHQARRAVREGAVDHVRVPRDPADVGRAPVDVLVLEIEDPLRRRVDPDQIAAGGVEDALRLPRRAGRVQDVERDPRRPSSRAGSGVGASFMRSCHHWSRPSRTPTSSPVRRTTTTCAIDGVFSRASSAICFNGTTFPRRQPPSAVTRTFAFWSLIRSRRDSAENPPNTTEWIAPMRAHASIATGSSGIIGR